MPMRSLYHQSKVATKPLTAEEAAKAVKESKAAEKLAGKVDVKKVKIKKESK